MRSPVSIVLDFTRAPSGAAASLRFDSRRSQLDPLQRVFEFGVDCITETATVNLLLVSTRRVGTSYRCPHL